MLLARCSAEADGLQALLGVTYLHARDIYHRDIKDENLILDEHFQLKVINR